MLERTMTDEEYENGKRQINRIIADLKRSMDMNRKLEKGEHDGS